MEDLEKVLERVRKLLALADHPNTPKDEADLSRNRAEALMLKYRIEEATLVAKGVHGDSEGGRNPVWRTMTICSMDSEFTTSYRILSATVMQHVGTRGIVRYEEGYIVLHTVGFLSDLMYQEVLLTACILEFGKRLEPKVDPSLSDAENAWLLRAGGWERKRIALELFGDWQTENEMKAKNRKVTALIKKHAESIGEDWSDLLGRGNNIKTFRRSYAEGFTEQITTRLWRMRTAQGQESAALVLADRKERIDEAFYEKFPNLRPSEKPPAPTGPCQKCLRAKSGRCREHRLPSFRPSAESYAGRRRGADAALHVNLGPNATGTGRVGKPSTRALE